METLVSPSHVNSHFFCCIIKVIVRVFVVVPEKTYLLKDPRNMTWLGNSRQRSFFPICKRFPSCIAYLLKVGYLWRDAAEKGSVGEDEEMRVFVYRPINQKAIFSEPFALCFEVPTSLTAILEDQ